ncbi:hypothetical protein FGO68_gene11449 [Halteria grandinella]|uniref:Uncharacterized protein n=1 Tax=Halteria grandinella TaxID=5974 RepID=A0A8J8N8T8_HALGN|nr:hypothetical protein FGO68_gene11449 [Halteria grandinella]
MVLSAAAELFSSAYEEVLAIGSSLSLHTALIALARVEGKSPVNYLDTSKQSALVSYTKDILGKGDQISIVDLFQRSKG